MKENYLHSDNLVLLSQQTGRYSVSVWTNVPQPVPVHDGSCSLALGGEAWVVDH